MKLNRILVMTVAFVAIATAAYAQFPFGGDDTDTTPPWDTFKLNPKTRITLDFRNANVTSVLHMFSTASGITIIVDPTLTGGITLQSPKPQSLDDAFAELQAVLNLKNFDITAQGNFLMVKAKAQQGGFRQGNNPFGQGNGFGNRNQSNLQVYPIKYASASAVAKVINDVFATTTGNQPGAFPFGGGGGGGGFGGGAFGGGANGGGRNANTPQVKASSEDYSNSVIVNAPDNIQGQIKTIIDQVDKPTEQPNVSRVFKLQFSAASDLQPVIQNVLAANAPHGLGQATTTTPQPQNPFQRFFGGGGGNNSSSGQTAGGSVIAETRTNSLIVTAIRGNIDVVAQVIKRLDRPAAYENTSFVIVLKYARPDFVANLLNSAFSKTASTGSSLTVNSGSVTGQTVATTGLAATATTTTAAPARTAPTGSTSFGGRTQQTAQTSTAPSTITGVNSTGQVVDIRDLTGDLVVVPDIDTNSLLVVCSPQNRGIVEHIVAQLDQDAPQVMVETLVVEASLTATDQMGIEYNFGGGDVFGNKSTTQAGTTGFGLQGTTSSFGPTGVPVTATPPAPSGLIYDLTSGQYGIFLQALKTDTQFKVLSTPRIFSENNAQSQVNISQSLPYVTSESTDANGNPIYSYSYLDVGIVLTVTPRITQNGYVTMDVTQTANDLAGYAVGINAPIVNQREAQTTVSVQDGHTVVLGGLMQDQITSTVNKVPILGDLPLIGQLFRSTSKTKAKTELLLFLTPHVVRTPADAAVLKDQTEKELEKATLEEIPPSANLDTPAPPVPSPVTPGQSDLEMQPLPPPPPADDPNDPYGDDDNITAMPPAPPSPSGSTAPTAPPGTMAPQSVPGKPGPGGKNGPTLPRLSVPGPGKTGPAPSAPAPPAAKQNGAPTTPPVAPPNGPSPSGTN